MITEQKRAASAQESTLVPGSCPNCLVPGMDAFYEVRNIPVHSVLLMPTRERALNYPRRDLKLGFCSSCGFVGNMLFDPTVHEYSTQCEESQGFSPTFNKFAKDLAKRWVDQYHLKGKSVLEIGCGKGEFLALLVELGMNNGIGIDPAYIPGRLQSTALDRLEFVQDLYSEEYTHLQADVICCRHTLEHIAPTHAFMSMIRRTIGDRPDTLILFELPDVYRVLKEAAFWDIYYEHCTYFTTGSLARLFRNTGFDVLELGLDFDDQYILLVAKPTNRRTSPSLPLENDLEKVRAEVAAFPKRFAEVKNRWLTNINAEHAAGRKTILWGGGSKAVSFLTTLGLGEQINSVVDINPHKHGKFIPGAGHPVVGPESLLHDPPDTVILMNPVYVNEVRAQLNSMGLDPQIVAV
jgi:SAM-dependent methyltransferase